MDFDLDLGNDAAAAFSSASLRSGAILPFEGRSLLMRGDGLPAAALEAERDGWLGPETPILVRGAARILPLAWRGDPRSGDTPHAEPGAIAQLDHRMQSAGMYWAGPWRVLDLGEARSDSIGSYTAALLAAGAVRVDCWTYSETVGLALVRAGMEDEGTRSLALQLVPVSWVSERRAGKAVRGIDVRWSWAEVIALHAARSGAGVEPEASSREI